jgi:hypothetical protein
MMAYVEDEDLNLCIKTLDEGKDFTFALYGESYAPYDEEKSGGLPWTTVTITSMWYNLVYYPDEWNPDALRWALESFAEKFKQIDDLPMSIRYAVEWR